MAKSRHLTINMAALVAAIFMCAALNPATAQPDKRSGVGPCRQGELSLIAKLDSGEDNTADYREVYEAVVQTCEPVAAATAPSQPHASQAECRKLAVAVLDTIEGRQNEHQGFCPGPHALRAILRAPLRA
ncbi:hypothetical protein [Bradyrhizobium sp. Ash2021]|uniref:hypothetical protein n=1 Tax=Bradyrhizobium sp. Ash2021 TaxID=2954771 RepID=UPI002815F1CE|nr:hypothetical protein [Bradyrhizobium sp. Ash2021]WMT73811.1 hypothetical protein NL528_38780 [Bradyrhizobium sp. Ash2021]